MAVILASAWGNPDTPLDRWAAAITIRVIWCREWLTDRARRAGSW